MIEPVIHKRAAHQLEINCVRCATRFVTPTDEHHRAIRLLCNGCSAVTGQTVHKSGFGWEPASLQAATGSGERDPGAVSKTGKAPARGINQRAGARG